MSYPGKDKNIPGRIIEALEDLPLSYLVPKDGLAALVNAPMRVSLPFDKTIFTSADDGRDVNINVLGTANSTTSSIKNEAEKERLVFKDPVILRHQPILLIMSQLTFWKDYHR